ncbi:MAG TPA: triose-phosphate isomerase, partial [Allocoleopsis sp.]
MRKIVIAGNWKMYKTQAESLEFLKGFMPELEKTPDDREIIISVPFTTLGILSQN